jgi:capsid assembly protease
VPPTPHKDTAVVDTPWDGAAMQARLSNDAGQATYQQMYAWRNPDGDPDAKGSYKLPHHNVDTDGAVGPANVNGVRAALAAVGGARGGIQMPDRDKGTVRANLQKHLDKFNRDNSSSSEDFAPPAGDSELLVALAETKVWAMRPELLAGLARVDRRVSALALEPAAADGPGRGAGGGIAVVNLRGVVTPRPSLLMALFGGGSGALSTFLSDLNAAAADPDVRAVVLDVDSPGGLVDLVPEAAARVRALRDEGDKPIVAVANTQASSAAYWLAAQANEVVVTPSGELGSIGVYSLHRDLSGMFEQLGVKHTLVSAGRYKIEGNPYEPLGDEALAAEQGVVDDYYAMFLDDVAAGRGADPAAVEAGYGQGRTLTAKRAVRAGLADRVATLADTVSRLSTGPGRARLKRAPASAAASPASYTKDERLRLIDALVASR